MKRSPLPYLALISVVLSIVLAACTAESGETPGTDTEPADTTVADTGGETDEAPDDTGTTTVPETTGDKPVVVGALGSAINILEPHTFRSTAAYAVTDALYEPLIEQVFEEDENGLLVGSREDHEGAGAETYEITETDEGGLLGTFQLREDAMFPDGTPVTAEDYKYIFDRSILGPGYIGVLLPFIGIESPDQIRAVDEYTLEIESNIQSPLFERFLTFQVFGALNDEEMEANATADDEWAFAYLADKGAGSGPYVVETYEPDSQVVLTPAPNYWDSENIANSGVTLQEVPDANQRALLVQSGEIDFATDIPPQLLANLEGDENVRIYSAPTTGVQYMGMNQTIAPLDNVDVRRAMMHAVPYQALLDQVLFGYAAPAGGVVTSTMETHDTEIGGQYTTDLELAAQYLEDSGVGEVNLELDVRESRSTDQEAAVLIQDNLRQIGINVEVSVLPDADFSERLNNGEMPLFIHDWYSWGEDPFYQMQFLSTCEQTTNYSLWCNEDYDALVEEGKFTIDPEVRADVSSQAQQIFFDEAVWAPLWSTDRTLVTRSCLTGVSRGYTNVPAFEYLSTEGC